MSVFITQGGRNIVCIGHAGREEYCPYLLLREGGILSVLVTQGGRNIVPFYYTGREEYCPYL